MIHVRLQGGLGNQMFQYALGRFLSKKFDVNLYLDISQYDQNNEIRSYGLNHFNIKATHSTFFNSFFYCLPVSGSSILSRLFRKLIKKKNQNKIIINEKDFNFDPDILEIRKGYLIGNWQTEKYFFSIKNILQEEFTLKTTLSPTALTIAEKIKSSVSTSLHIRRGDYAIENKTNIKHGLCGLEYYQKATALIIKKNPETVFYVFSDDIEWAKQNLSLSRETIFVSHKNIPDYEELILMSLCKNNIIANSTFSWWGAWLNRDKNKMVIAPQRWFRDEEKDTPDIIPKSWIRL